MFLGDARGMIRESSSHARAFWPCIRLFLHVPYGRIGVANTTPELNRGQFSEIRAKILGVCHSYRKLPEPFEKWYSSPTASSNILGWDLQNTLRKRRKSAFG